MDAGKPVVLVLATSRPWILPDWLVDGCSAILLAMFGGTEAGHAIADVLCGDYNPSGRLCISWPYRIGQIPVYYSMRSTGRPHNPEDSWTTSFLDSPVGVSVEVANRGSAPGEATLFLFISDPVAMVTRPVIELKDFAKSCLAPGETGVVQFTLRADQLTYPDLDMEPRLDDGRIEIHIGQSSRRETFRSTAIEVRRSGCSHPV